MLLFISGAEIVFVFFIILLVFGADKIPSIARTLAKGMTEVRRATNDIKSEIQKTVDVDIENPSKSITNNIKEEVDKVKSDFNDLEDSFDNTDSVLFWNNALQSISDKDLKIFN